jgi:hypothetical protein
MKKIYFTFLFLLVLITSIICTACSKENEEKVAPVPEKGSVVNGHLGDIQDVEGRLLRYSRMNTWYVQTENSDTYLLFLQTHEVDMTDELKEVLSVGAHVLLSGKVYALTESVGDKVPELKELIGQNKAFGMVAPDITIKRISE